MSDNVRWEPMLSYEQDADDSISEMEYYVDDKLARIHSYGDGAYTLPPDVRLCRAVPVAMPEPDWSQAPPRANWWAVEPATATLHGMRRNGRWFALEPYVRGAGWVTVLNDCGWPDRVVDLPLGVDWRLTLIKRPEADNE